MNVNYVHINKLPNFDHYEEILDAVSRGDNFVSTGEVLLTKSKISSSADSLHVEMDATFTFPLRVAEIVWGDGKKTHREQFDLQDTHEFGKRSFAWDVDAANWTWARLAVWDVAGDGAFSNATWRK